MAISSYSSNGAKSATATKLPSSVFAVEVKNHQLLKDAYLAYMANGRVNLAKTLKRGEVSGGGIKPWRQKGTGRARFGSSRNPIWRSGGIAFGPTGQENYTRSLNVKTKRKALAQALTLAAKDKNLLILDDFEIKDSKTKSAVKLLNKIGADSRTLIVTVVKSENNLQATKNIPEVKLTTVKNLNVFDVLNASNLVIVKKAIEDLELRLGSKK